MQSTGAETVQTAQAYAFTADIHTCSALRTAWATSQFSSVQQQNGMAKDVLPRISVPLHKRCHKSDISAA
jgi:hypothetical protein